MIYIIGKQFKGENIMYLKKLINVSLLLICVLIFGAWTPITAAPLDRYAEVELRSTRATEIVEYTYRDDSVTNSTDGGCPKYYQINGLTNGCGAVAGSIIVGFYDKYYSNLIPNWEPIYASSGKYRLQDSVYVPNVMNELYTLMRTNVDDVGVSESDFKNGLKAYINNHGYNINYQSVKSGNNLDFDSCRSAIDNNKVIALLANPGDIYDMTIGTNSDTIVSYNISGAHIMIAFGYRQIKYYNSSGLFRTDTYLEVATGLTVLTTALYKINPHNLSNAYIINIS